MSTNIISSDQIKKLDKELSDIANSKEYCLDIIKTIRSYLDSYITTQSIDVLDQVLDNYRNSALTQTSESRRLYIICTILKGELDNNSISLFSNNVQNVQALYDRYIYSILMIRRLTLDFPDELQAEAKDYLININISPYACIQILSNELFEDFEYTLTIISDIMHESWNTLQNTHFAMHVAECFPTENNCLKVASYCMDLQHYSLAYSYLLKISNPSPITLELISTLKGVLNEQ